LPYAVAVPTAHILEWLALSLTFGLGPSQALRWSARAIPRLTD